MSQLLARIMLAIFMLPCAAVLYVIAVVSVDSRHLFSYPVRRYAMWFIAGAVSWTFIAIYWSLLWKASVQWTRQRVRRSLVASAVALGVGVVAGTLMSPVDTDFGIWVGTVIAPLVWLILTTLAWRETAAERAARATGQAALTCPTCGYNLTGLQGTRCPECGTLFTVDELISRQTRHSEADLH
jgi:hypothetical protein